MLHNEITNNISLHILEETDTSNVSFKFFALTYKMKSRFATCAARMRKGRSWII